MRFPQFTWIALGSAILAAMLTGCGDKQTAKKNDAPIPVQTMTAEATSQPYWADVFGQTEGSAALEVYPQVSGPVIKRNYTEGKPVKKGDVLFTIDPEPFQAAYDSAHASVLQARATYEKDVREAKRYAELWKARAVSQKEYTDAQSAMRISDANLKAAKAKEKEASIALGYTKVRAAADGIAGRALVNPGTLVSAHDTQLTDITQDNDLKVRFSVSDYELHGFTLTENTAVEVHNDNLKQPVKGKIDFTATQIDPQTGTRSLSAKLDKSELLPGQYVTVRVILGMEPNVFLVPQSAIRQLSDGNYSVYVIRNGLARTQNVSVGRWVGKNWIVTDGIKPGDEVILDQIQKLKDRRAVVKTSASKQ